MPLSPNISTAQSLISAYRVNNITPALLIKTSPVKGILRKPVFAFKVMSNLREGGSEPGRYLTYFKSKGSLIALWPPYYRTNKPLAHPVMRIFPPITPTTL